MNDRQSHVGSISSGIALSVCARGFCSTYTGGVDVGGYIFMNLALPAMMMIIILLALIIWSRIPTPVIMMSVPVGFALICGYGMSNTLDRIMAQFHSVMGNMGYMLLFSLIYFQMLTETGMFEQMIQAVLKVVGNKMNVVMVFILTTVIALAVGLTTNIVAVYLIVFPIVIPLYKKFNMDRIAAVILAQTASCVFAFLPWNYNLTLGVASTGCNLNELAAASFPWSMCLIPVVVLQWIYFSLRHRQEHGTLGAEMTSGTKMTLEVEISGDVPNENLNARPRLFWINAAVFIAVIAALTVFSFPAWFVFCAAAFATTIINYCKDYAPIWNKCAPAFLNILTMLLAVSAYIAVFTYGPEGGSSMAEALAAWLIGAVPGSMMRYTAVLFLLALVLLVRLAPYQISVAMYPMLVSIGAEFGISAVSIIAPLVTCIGLGTGVSPMTASTYVSATLAEVEMDELSRRGVGIMSVSLFGVVVVAALWGMLPL